MCPQAYAFHDLVPAEVILAVRLSKPDRSALENIFATLPWKLTAVSTLAESVRRARTQSVPVMLCDRDLPGGGWKSLLERVGTLAQPPRLIVTSRLADESLWSEVLNIGGHDVLATPFDALEVQRVVSSASESWHWQYDGRPKIRVVGGGIRPLPKLHH